ncbi:hypothetical protein ACVWYQ_004341 [Bradyrhizobium sp. USDA 3397]
MLMTKEGRPAGAIHECEQHGWAKDRGDPHAP